MKRMIVMIVVLAVTVASSAAARYEPQPHYKPDYPEAQYGFAYDVKDSYTNVDLGHEENRNGDDVKGTYNVLLPDGRRQVVNYYVNGYSGFVAEVEFQGEAKPAADYPSKPSYPAYLDYPKPSYEPVYPRPTYEPTYPKPTYEPNYPQSTYEPSYPQPTYEPAYPKPSYPKYEPFYPSKPYEAYKPTYPSTQKAYPATEAYVQAYPEPRPVYPSTTYRPAYEPKRAATQSQTTKVQVKAAEEVEAFVMDEASISKTMSKPLFRDEAEAMVKSESRH